MSVMLEKIYELALEHYKMRLVAGENGIWNLVDWVHELEDIQVVDFLKGRELIVTTGTNLKSEEELLQFTQAVYEAKASGLVFNIGTYIRTIPENVLEFAKANDFPIFTLPWEVHLVDFNRGLCNLIYETQQENRNLEDAFQKVIFSPENKEDYLPVLRREGILADTRFCMIQCAVFTNSKNRKILDVPQHYYRYTQRWKKALSRLEQKGIVFHYDQYLTVILINPEASMARRLIQEVNLTAPTGFVKNMAVSPSKTTLKELSQEYQRLTQICKRNAKVDQEVTYEEELGAVGLLLQLPDYNRLQAYHDQILGDLLAADQAHKTEYCKILKTYLEENGNVQEVAAQCYLHRNTVSYHLKKIAEITHRDITQAHERAELYLAFSIQEYL